MISLCLDKDPGELAITKSGLITPINLNANKSDISPAYYKSNLAEILGEMVPNGDELQFISITLINWNLHFEGCSYIVRFSIVLSVEDNTV